MKNLLHQTKYIGSSGDSKKCRIRNSGITNKPILFLCVFHYSKPFFPNFIVFQPAKIISVHYNVGELTNSVR